MNPRRIGIDTETTGLELRHNCGVFQTSIVWEARPGEPAYSKSWRWDVRPNDRRVLIPEAEAREIRGIVEDPQFLPIFANSKFDVLGLQQATGLEPYGVLRRCRDIILESHLLDSSESHALKDLAFKYADIDTRDVDYLKKVITSARNEAEHINAGMRRLGFDEPFMLASKHTFCYAKTKPVDGWWIADTWLAHAVNKWKKFFRANNPKLYKQVIRSQEMFYDESAADAYCSMDAIRTLVMDQILWAEIEKKPQLLDIYNNIQHRCLEVDYRMESNGLPINLDTVDKQIVEFKATRDEEFKQCIRISGNPNLNPASGKALRHLLYKQWGQPVKKWTTPEKEETPPSPSTDIDALCYMIQDNPPESPVNQFCRHLILGKKTGTSVNYLTGYKAAALEYIMEWSTKMWWRLHPSINETGTRTTRTSSNHPNAQNIGKGKIAKPEDIARLIKEILEGMNISLRRVFGPMPGREWWAADYKQLQLAIFAFVTKDPQMIAAILAGRDFHDFMTRKIYHISDGEEPTEGQRTVGKNIDFGYIFGAGDDKINTVSGIEGLADTLRALFPHAASFIAATSDEVRRNGVVYAGGYPLQVDQSKPYAGVNYIVQGYEGIIVKRAMVLCHDYLLEATANRAWIALNVHDELIFDFPEGEGEHHVWNIRDLMIKAGSLYDMQLGVDFKYTTTNWADTQKVTFDPDYWRQAV